jgi:hypothetical protein
LWLSFAFNRYLLWVILIFLLDLRRNSDIWNWRCGFRSIFPKVFQLDFTIICLLFRSRNGAVILRIAQWKILEKWLWLTEFLRLIYNFKCWECWFLEFFKIFMNALRVIFLSQCSITFIIFFFFHYSWHSFDQTIWFPLFFFPIFCHYFRLIYKRYLLLMFWFRNINFIYFWIEVNRWFFQTWFSQSLFVIDSCLLICGIRAKLLYIFEY